MRAFRGWTGALAAAALVAFAATGAAAEPVTRAAVEAALPGLRALAEDQIAQGAVPGLAIAVVHDGAVIFAEGFGVREAGAPQVVDADTVFQIASMSKPISATVVAALVGEGLLDWDTHVVELDPGFALHDPYPTAEVTVRDLFSHRSGLPGSAGDDLEAIGYDRAHVMRQLRLVPPSSSFRAGYAYSNAGLTAGALAAARAAGAEWEAVAQDRLFGPLAMASTSYSFDDFAGRPNAARLHVRMDGAWTAQPRRDATPQAPAGGASSSVRDLARWMLLVLGGGATGGETLIPPEALAPVHAPLMSLGPNPISGEPTFYGLGWNLTYGAHGPAWGHAGAFSVGARSVVRLLSDSQLGIVVLANAFPTGAPEGLADSFFDLVFDGAVTTDRFGPWNALFDGLFAPAMAAAQATYAAPPDPATPALPLSAYTGSYANAYVGRAEVAEDAGRLLVAVGPGGVTRLPLVHFDRDTFLAFPAAETPDFPTSVRFAIGPDGRAAAVTVEALDTNGLGTLTREK